MLFNSFSFLFLFLPITWLVWRACLKFAGLRPRHKRREQATFESRSATVLEHSEDHRLKIRPRSRLCRGLGLRIGLLCIVLASLVFYSMWDVRYLPLLLGSIGLNFYLGGKIIAAKQTAQQARAKIYLRLGILFNLLVLGVFKYSFFIASSITSIWDGQAPFDAFVLPLAISFVTFQKIAYLVDCERGVVAQHDALDYLFFVSFFPQLIAGPIVHHRPLIAQARPQNPLLFDVHCVQVGWVMFCFGLFKKVVLADSLANFATPLFNQAQHAAIATLAAWQAAIAYSLQLYFDFSGYSDMAIGLALMFGFKLPQNFNSPYRADSIIDFWRRWHISLSQFLRDYVYVPLGGNRDGAWKRYRNIGITMLIGGIWHGAGWTFVLWGALHALFILINHVLRDCAARSSSVDALLKNVPRTVKIALTFILIVHTWVIFRAPDLATAWTIYHSMWSYVPTTGMEWSSHWAIARNLETILMLHPATAWTWIVFGLMIVWFLPNSQKMVHYDQTPNQALVLRRPLLLGIVSALALLLSLKWMAVQPASEFLYFNF